MTSSGTASPWSVTASTPTAATADEILRRRIVPRLLDAEPGTLLGADGQLDPARAWEVMMRNEKPGGHGERSVAVGVVDMALFDLAAKIAGQPLYRWLSDRYGDGELPCPASSAHPAGMPVSCESRRSATRGAR